MRYSTHIYTKIVASIMLAVFVMLPMSTQAISFFPTEETDPTGLLNTEAAEELSLGDVVATVAILDLINLSLTLLAGLILGMFAYAAVLWIWARGNPEMIEKAKEIIKGAIIGLVIVLSSLGIVQFVFLSLADITGATVEGQETP